MFWPPSAFSRGGPRDPLHTSLGKNFVKRTAYLIDLGLAKTVGDSTPESEVSVAGGFAGTPEFTSPEQFAGVRVDIPIGSILAWGTALGKAYWQGTILDFVPFFGV